MLKISAIAEEAVEKSSTAAMTALTMCLNDLTTISWMHIDCICGSFSASSTCYCKINSDINYHDILDMHISEISTIFLNHSSKNQFGELLFYISNDNQITFRTSP